MFILEELSGIRDFFSRIGSLELSRIVKSLAIVAATLSAGLIVASPAQAAPYWQAVNTNSNWRCGDTTHHLASVNVLMQTCIVKTPDLEYGQAVLVVRNNANVAVNIKGFVVTDFGGNADCDPSTLNPGRVVGCYGPTKKINGPLNAQSQLWMNEHWSETEPVRV